MKEGNYTPLGYLEKISKTIFFVLFFTFSSSVFAQESLLIDTRPEIKMSIFLNNKTFKQGDEINGYISFQNRESYSVSDLSLGYTLYLFPEGLDTRIFTSADIKAFGISFSENKFSLLGGESKKIPIKYDIPANIPGGEYRLEVSLVRKNVSGQNSRMVPLGQISGDRSYINIKNTSMLKGSKSYGSLAGVGYGVEEEKYCRVMLENTSDKTLKISFSSSTYERFIGGSLIHKDTQSAGTLSPGEVRAVKVLMPAIKDPQSYITTLQFQSEQGIVSPITACRWLIQGESASISIFELDKSTYMKGETAQATVFITGPVDNTAVGEDHPITDLGNVDLKILIVDYETGSTVGQFEKEVRLGNSINTTFPVSITEKTDHYQAVLTVSTQSGKVLAYREIEDQIARPSYDFKGKLPYLLILPILLVIYLVIRLFKRKKENA